MAESIWGKRSNLGFKPRTERREKKENKKEGERGTHQSRVFFLAFNLKSMERASRFKETGIKGLFNEERLQRFFSFRMVS